MLRLFLAALVAGGAIIAACGGGDDEPEGTPTPIATLAIEREVPESFPDDFPVYPGATFKGGVDESEPSIFGTIAVWETADSLDAVSVFFDDALVTRGGTWSSPELGVKDATSAYWAVRAADGTQDGSVNAQVEGGVITINVTILSSEDSGAE